MPDSQAKARVLLVEDDRDIRDTVNEVLEDEGYCVTGAEDGLRALDELRRAPVLPDLIILDLMMPNMDGFQFREEQCKDARYAAIPVAVLSADANVAEKAAKLKVAGFMQKPLEVDALLELVEQALRDGAHGCV
ncbi:MAG TPA: response regulator [Polyangiaceae bacterium]|jgi:DNA-binding response OmpR family regulator|nr:response regulator [Polyangiaceae bacterium]